MAAITSAVIAGVTAVYGIASAEGQKSKAKGMKNAADARQIEFDKKEKERIAGEKATDAAGKDRANALRRQKSSAAESQGRAGTILAGGPSEEKPNTTLGGGQGKTLLGT